MAGMAERKVPEEKPQHASRQLVPVLTEVSSGRKCVG